MRKGPKPFRNWLAAQQGCCAVAVSDLLRERRCLHRREAAAIMKTRSARPLASVTACSLVFCRPFGRPIRRSRSSPARPFTCRLKAVRSALRYLGSGSRTNGEALAKRRSSPVSARCSRRPVPPSTGRRHPLRPTTSKGCRAPSEIHTPWACRTTAKHCD